MGTDETELKDEKLYRTGGSGYWGPLALGLLALGIMTLTIATGLSSRWIGEAMAEGRWAKLLVAATGLVINLGALSLVVYGAMQRRNASVAVSEHGLTRTNWRKRTKVMQWEDVVGVGYGETFGSALWLELVVGGDERGRGRDGIERGKGISYRREWVSWGGVVAWHGWVSGVSGVPSFA